MRATIKDVAKMCGVSISTVSRVLSDDDRISEKTKKKVNDIIKKIGYMPNSSAQNLINNSTNIIGLVIQYKNEDILHNSFFIEMINHISTLFMKKGYYILYVNCYDYKDEYKKVTNLVMTSRVDGIIFLTLKNTDMTLKFLKEIDFPFVVIGTPKDKKNILWVDNDNVLTTYEITNNLIKKGFKDIIFIGGSLELEVTKNRYLGYKKALNDNNLRVYKKNTLETEFDEMEAYNTLKKYIQKFNKNIDAIITTDDVLAIGSIMALNEYNLNAKVVGFNDTIIRKYIQPKFATVNINVDKLAQSAYELLFNKLHSFAIDKNYRIIETKFIDF